LLELANRSWQIERTKLRGVLAGCRVTVHEHLDDTLSITFGPHVVGRYQSAAATTGTGTDLEKPKQKAA
jgi:hypothetical protein